MIDRDPYESDTIDLPGDRLRWWQWIDWPSLFFSAVFIIGMILVISALSGCAAVKDAAVEIAPKVQAAVDTTAAVASKVDEISQRVGDNSQAISDSSSRNDTMQGRILAAGAVLSIVMPAVMLLLHRQAVRRITDAVRQT